MAQNKVTDKSKRSMKKRHAYLHGGQQPSNRVNKYLAQAIEARSMGQEKSNHVHALSLCFRDSSKEHMVSTWFIPTRWRPLLDYWNYFSL